MNKNLRKVVGAWLLAMLCSNISLAQSGQTYEVADLEVWTGAKLNYKPNKDWSISLEQQLRLKDDASTVDLTFTELEITRNINKHFALSLGTRFIRENDNEGKIQGYESHFRWNTDLSYKHKVQNLSLKYRVRYQSKNELMVDDVNVNTFRFKTGLNYNIKKWKLDPKFSAEIFSRLQDNDGLDKLRLTLGTDYKLTKASEIGMYYRLEKQLQGIYPKTTYILGLSYEYTFKNKNK